MTTDAGLTHYVGDSCEGGHRATDAASSEVAAIMELVRDHCRDVLPHGELAAAVRALVERAEAAEQDAAWYKAALDAIADKGNEYSDELDAAHEQQGGADG